MYKRKILATLALSAIVVNTMNFTVVEDWLGSMHFVPKAEAAHSQGLGCNPISSTNQATYTNVSMNCWDTIVKPVGDSGATHVHLGVHTTAPNAFTSWTAPNLHCFTDNGGARLNCKNFLDSDPTGTLIPIPEGGTRQVDFVVRVSGQCGTTQQLTSTVANVYGVNSTPEVFNYTFPACPGPVFPQGTKTGPNTVIAGQDITYQISFTNAGTTQQNIRIADVIPAGLTFKPTGSTAGCAATNGVVFCPAQTVNAGATISATLVFTVSANAACNAIIDNAADLQQNNASFQWTNHKQTTVQCPAPQFTGTKTVNSATVAPGGNLTYTITFTNNGTTQQNIRIADVIPAGLTFVPGSSTAGCAATNGVVFCPAQTVNAGGTISATLAFTVAANATCNAVIDNVADLQQNNTSFAWTNHAQTTVQCVSVDLSIIKNGPQTPVIRGQNVTYTLTLSNAGPANATNVAFTDQFPADLTFVSAAGATCAAPVNNVVSCTLANLAAGQTVPVTLVFSTQLGQVCTQAQITNTAQVSTANDPVTVNNVSSVNTTLTCPAPQFTGTKTVNSATVAPGEFLTYTITATNNGAVTQQGIRIADVIPAGLTYISQQSTAGCTVANGVAYCPTQTVNPGATVTATLVFQVNPGAQCNSIVANIADIQQNNTSFAWTNQVQTSVQCPVNPDVTITKTGPATAVRGTQFSYVVTARNDGTVPATNVSIADQVPNQLTYVSATGATCSLANGVVTCQLGTLNPGQQVPVTLVFTTQPVQAPAACSTVTATNVATVSAANDGTPNNNTATATTSITCPDNPTVDLVLTKTGQTAAVQFGQQVSYVISVTNNGPSTANNVTINDPVPNNLSYASAAGANCALALPLGGGNGFVSCDFGSMTVGQTKQVTLTFTTIAPPPNCQAITVTNTATVTSTTPETNNGNNTDSDSTQLTCPAPQQADLSVAKTGPNLIQTGNNVEYVVTVTNNGPGTANTVLVRDIVPMGMTFSAFSGNAACQLANNNTEVQCTIATLGAGQSQQIHLIFTTPNPGNNCSAMTATNTAIVSSNTQDPNQGNNVAHAFTTINCPGNLNFFETKTGPATIRRGERITYTVTLTNQGNTTENIRIGDHIPTNLTFVAPGFGSETTPGCQPDNQGNIFCAYESFSPGQTRTYKLQFQVPQDYQCGGDIDNIADAQKDGVSFVWSNHVHTTVTCDADLAVVKTVSNATPNVGANVTFTIAATNNGPGNATNVRVTDLLPQGLTFVSATPSTGTYNSNTGLWDIGTLNSGVTKQLQIVATVAVAGTRTNTASITGDVNDTNTGNNTSSASVTTAAATADLAVTKTASTTTPTVGSNVTFTITVTNNGPSTAQNARVTDVLPQGLTFVSATPTVGTYAQNTGLWTIGTLNSGATATLQIVATASTAGTVINTASGTSDVTDPNTANNTSSVTVTIGAVVTTADLAVTKIASTTTPTVGSNVTFTIVVTNNGPSAAQNARVTDLLPQGLTYVTNATAQGTYNQTTGVWTIGTLSSGATATLQIVATASTAGTVINTASGTSDTQDPVTTNNSSSVTVNIGGTNTTADLYVTKTGPSSANRGENLTYVITATNNGPGTASNVLVKDTINGTLSFVSASGAQCSMYSTTELRCTIATMTSGQNVPITVVFTTQQQSTCSTATVSDVATISSDTTDPNSGNNTSATITTSINCPQPNLTVNKTDGRSSANVGDVLSYTITVSNTNNVATSNLTIKDSLPSGLNNVSAGNGGNVSGNEVTWTNQSVPANGTLTLTVNGTVQNVGNGSTLTNYVTVNGSNVTGTLSASDQTTVYSNTVYNPPPYNPPPYYPPYQPPIYNPPPYNPPVVQPPVVQPPVYTPPPYNPVFPQTGSSDLYAQQEDTSKYLSKPEQNAPEQEAADNFGLIFFATLAGIFAVGSAAAGKFAGLF